MNKFLKITIFLACIQNAALNATVLVQGNASILNEPLIGVESPIINPNANYLTFTQPVTAEVFDRRTRNLYVGLGNLPVTTVPPLIAPVNNYNISVAQRPVNGMSTGSGTPAFTPIALNASLQNIAIDFLALSHSHGPITPVLSIVPAAAKDTPAGELIQKSIFFSSPDGTITQESQQLLSANNTLDANGVVIFGIVGLAANHEFAFVATYTDADPDTGGFGSPDSGIAVVAFDPTTLLPHQTSAQPGDTGIKSARFDETTPAIVIQGIPDIKKNRVSMFWDGPLQRLYLGIQLRTAVDSLGVAGDGDRSVVVTRVDENGTLYFDDFVDGSTVTPGDATKIVVARQVDMASTMTLSANHLNVMHCSTGPSYLIVNGGNGSYTTDSSTGGGTVGNLIWALPLVDLGQPTNPNQGKEADKTSFNTATHTFQTPSSDANLTTINDPFAQVGAGPIPVQADVPVWGAGSATPSTQNSLDIKVEGDTVYVAIGTPQASALDDTGVFYSQALFDQDGKISHWTPWAKRALPYEAFATIPDENSTVRFVEVDAVTGKVWAVDNSFGQTVVITGWNSGIFTAPLPLAINQSLHCSGCYSVLDLDQTTTQLGSQTSSRYALFGGINQVDFAQTASSLVAATPFNVTTNNVPAPQEIFDKFTPGGPHFLVSQLPQVAGAVTSLEFSRRPANTNQSYFFAGTNTGLFVYSQGGNGFDVTQMHALNAPPFTNSSWQQITSIAGSVVDIKTSGQKLYVLTRSKNSSGKFISTLYSIAFTTNITTMFAPGNMQIIAQSGVSATGSDLSSTLSFYGLQVLVLNATTLSYDEQIALATNAGLFISHTVGGVQTATNQATALFAPLTDTALTVGIAGIDTPAPTVAWPFTLQDPSKLGLFNASSIRQVDAGQNITDQFNFVPAFFNASMQTAAFTNLDPINYFWSDGNRRLFIASNSSCSQDGQALESLPFHVREWNLSAPYDINDAVVNQTLQFNWIKQIGSTGLLLVGTNNGVIALQ